MDIAQFFKDGDGQLSAMRLVFITWGLGTFIVWAILCGFSGSLMNVPVSIVEIMALSLGSKIAQSYIENKKPTSTN